MLARKVMIAAVLVLTLALGGCGQPAQDSGPGYADDEAMQIIADGLEARSDVVDEQHASGESGTTAAYKDLVQTELDIVSPLRDRQFEDSELQEQVVAYINTLEDSMDVIDSYPTSDGEFYLKWTEVYDERTALLSTFVDEYDLTLDEKYQDVLEDLASNGAAALQQSEMEAEVNALLDNMTFEKESTGYGYFDYKATVENTTEYNLTDVSLVLALYDEEGVRMTETYAFVNSWAAGEKIRFEATSDFDAAEVKPEFQYYSVDR